jgi:hypothetical protein
VEIDWLPDLPPGKIRVIIEPLDPATEAADEAQWTAQFAKSPQVSDGLIQEAHDEEALGLTDVWDPEAERPGILPGQ